jgi:hypothetical protein
MEYIGGWVILGALIGAIAASARGWSPVAGAAAGALLGCGAPLLFFVSGVTRSDVGKICPQCAEKVKHGAKVCRYCGTKF